MNSLGHDNYQAAYLGMFDVDTAIYSGIDTKLDTENDTGCKGSCVMNFLCLEKIETSGSTPKAGVNTDAKA